MLHRRSDPARRPTVRVQARGNFCMFARGAVSLRRSSGWSRSRFPRGTQGSRSGKGSSCDSVCRVASRS
jgi:hypothetical protein